MNPSREQVCSAKNLLKTVLKTPNEAQKSKFNFDFWTTAKLEDFSDKQVRFSRKYWKMMTVFT